MAGDTRIVGVEGGEHPVYHDPAYYDPVAMEQERVIIADFSTEATELLPTGRTRIATIHVRVAGEEQARYTADLDVSATVGGQPVNATITLETERHR